MPIVSTLIGGLLAVRFRRYISLLIAIGAGLLLGAAFLDLLPEAISLGVGAGLSYTDVLGLTLLSFLFFHACESGLDVLARTWRAAKAKRQIVGRTGAAMLIFHSFRDGMAIGAAYAASHPAGYAVAFGIVAHDLGDGMNTVILTTAGKAPKRTDYLFLAADAAAPFLGGASDLMAGAFIARFRRFAGAGRGLFPADGDRRLPARSPAGAGASTFSPAFRALRRIRHLLCEFFDHAASIDAPSKIGSIRSMEPFRITALGAALLPVPILVRAGVLPLRGTLLRPSSLRIIPLPDPRAVLSSSTTSTAYTVA